MNRCQKKSRFARSRRGLLIADVIIALSVVSILAGTLSVLVWQTVKLKQSQGDFRAAVRAAESALANLQVLRRPAPLDGEVIVVQAEPDGIAPPGRQWVRVVATFDGRNAELVGLVPDGPMLREALAGPQTRESK